MILSHYRRIEYIGQIIAIVSVALEALYSLLLTLCKTNYFGGHQVLRNIVELLIRLLFYLFTSCILNETYVVFIHDDWNDYQLPSQHSLLYKFRGLHTHKYYKYSN